MAEGGVHVMIVCADELATAMAAADRSGDAAKAPMLSTVWAVRALTCALQRGGLSTSKGALLVGDATDDDDADDGGGDDDGGEVESGVLASASAWLRRARRRRAGGGGAGRRRRRRQHRASSARRLARCGAFAIRDPRQPRDRARGVPALGSAGGGASRGRLSSRSRALQRRHRSVVEQHRIVGVAEVTGVAGAAVAAAGRRALATRALDAMARATIVAPAGGRAPRRTPAVGRLSPSSRRPPSPSPI